MNMLCSKLLLLADRSAVFREMGDGFREKRESFNPSDLLWWVVAAVIVLGAFGAIAHMLAKQDKRRVYNSPRALFKALCKAHELDRASCRLLKQIAQGQRLEMAARLFLEPDRFDSVNLSPSLRPQLEAVEALRTKLFAIAQSA